MLLLLQGKDFKEKIRPFHRGVPMRGVLPLFPLVSIGTSPSSFVKAGHTFDVTIVTIDNSRSLCQYCLLLKLSLF